MKLAKDVVLLILILVMSAGMVFAGGQEQSGSGSSGGAASTVPGTLPRKETLYFNGMLWDKVNHWNPYSVSDLTFGISITAGEKGDARQLIYETLFVYDMLTGTLKPQLADSYTWNGQTLTIQLNRNVKFWDGKPMTSADVVNSYQLQKT
jgi:peptide/nickel transport system substrate-binding protein